MPNFNQIKCNTFMMGVRREHNHTKDETAENYHLHTVIAIIEEEASREGKEKLNILKAKQGQNSLLLD